MAEERWKKTEFVYETDDAKVQSLMESFDPEMRFRALKGMAAKVVLIMCLILSLFHIYTAGFGVLQEWKHRCFHFAFVLSLVFLVFPTRKANIKNLTTTWVYEVLFSTMAGTILALGLQSVFKLHAAVAWLIFAIGFYLAFAMKTRDLWSSKVVPRLDLTASGIGLVVFLYGVYAILRNWGDYVGESSMGFVVWTFCILAAMAAPLIYMFYDSLRILKGQKAFVYDRQQIPYFEMTLAVIAFALSSYIIMDFDQFIYRAGLPQPPGLCSGKLRHSFGSGGNPAQSRRASGRLGALWPRHLLSGTLPGERSGAQFLLPPGLFTLPNHRPDVSWNRGALRGPLGGCGDLRFPFRSVWHLHHEDRPWKVLY